MSYGMVMIKFSADQILSWDQEAGIALKEVGKSITLNLPGERKLYVGIKIG